MTTKNLLNITKLMMSINIEHRYKKERKGKRLIDLIVNKIIEKSLKGKDLLDGFGDLGTDTVSGEEGGADRAGSGRSGGEETSREAIQRAPAKEVTNSHRVAAKGKC